MNGWASKLNFCWLSRQILGNPGVVKKKKVYRLGQSWHGLVWLFIWRPKTVINLSYKPKLDPQDVVEDWICKILGAKHVTHPTVAPPPYGKGETNVLTAFEELKEAVNTGATPVVVHCEGGRDRTGGLVALYKWFVMKEPLYNIVNEWPCFGTPGNDWIMWLHMVIGDNIEDFWPDGGDME
jgi:hypothetical protein